MDLLYFILAAYGLTQILVYGSIFNGWRPTKGKLGELFKCSMCMGFWVGALLMFLSPFTELFSFDISVENFLILGCISSGTSYVLSMTFGDEGFKMSKTIEVIK